MYENDEPWLVTPASATSPSRPQGVFTHGMDGREISSSRQQLNVILLVVVIAVVLGSCAAM